MFTQPILYGTIQMLYLALACRFIGIRKVMYHMVSLEKGRHSCILKLNATIRLQNQWSMSEWALFSWLLRNSTIRDPDLSKHLDKSILTQWFFKIYKILFFFYFVPIHFLHSNQELWYSSAQLSDPSSLQFIITSRMDYRFTSIVTHILFLNLNLYNSTRKTCFLRDALLEYDSLVCILARQYVYIVKNI